MKTLYLRLGVSEIATLRERFESLRGDLLNGRIAQDLAERGAEAAESAYGFPVSVEADGNRAEIIAAHEGLAFLEFGAGLTVETDNIYAGKMPFPVDVGSYSRANRGMFAMMLDSGASNPHWVFGGKVYDRIVPRAGMEAAGLTVMDEASEVIKEVVGL